MTQKILALFLESGNYQKHLRKLLLLSKRKRNIIVEELKKYNYTYSADSAGQHIIVDFGEDTEEIIKRASEKKIKIYPIKDYYYKKIVIEELYWDMLK